MRASETDQAGLAAGLLAYVCWGLLPLLILAAERAGAAAPELVAWRTLFAVPCAAVLVLVTGRSRELLSLPRRTYGALLLSAALIATNWLVYVFAVESHQTLTASLGYFINPLLNMAAGAILFHERLGRLHLVAIALAAVGVILQGAALGTLPWIPVILATTFCAYGIVRKQAMVSAQSGLLAECVLLACPAAAYAAMLLTHGAGVFGTTPRATWLLAACGPATVIPLAAFSFAARRLPLTVIGFLQFVSPSLQFAVGVLSGERLTPLRILSFAFIWAGIAAFGVTALRQRVQREAEV